MSTVVITPTHIGCDHNFVKHRFPHETEADLNFPKIFISPEKMFLIGVSGDLIIDTINTENGWKFFGQILSFIMKDLGMFGLINEGTILEEEITESFRRRIGDGHLFLVSRSHRFALKYDKKFHHVKARMIGDFAGIGSGGMIAAGLAINDPKLQNIWEPLHALDHLSSVEHTVYPLSVLKHVRQNAELLKDLRKIYDLAI